MIRENLFDDLRNIFKESLDNINIDKNKPSIMIIGRKGTGKRELISLLFDLDKTETDGRKEVYESDYIRIIVIDIEGNDNYRRIIEDISHETDVFWYTSNLDKLLKKEWDYYVLEELERYVPSALLITGFKSSLFQTHTEKKVKKIAEKIEVPIFPIFRKNEKPISKYEDYWVDLLKWTLYSLEESLQDDFATAPVTLSYLDEKRNYINRRVVPAYAAVSAVIGASPIPFSDALLLVPEQVSMAIHILKIYGIEESKQIVTSLIGSTVLSRIGKAVASSIIKIIPGAGTVIGGAVNASVASAFTISLGLTVSYLVYEYKKALISGENTSFEEYFNIREMKSVFNKFCNINLENRTEIDNNNTQE